MPDLDMDFVRSQFPAFAEPDLRPWAHFENGGGSYPCRQVIDRLLHYYTATKVQPYALYHPVAVAAHAAIEEAYHRLASLLGVAEDEVHFGPSTSQNTYVLAQAFRAGWGPQDVIIVTNQDHEANSGVWRRLADTGITVREWSVDPATGQLDLSDLHRLLDDRVRLIAMPHVSNVIGVPNPVAAVSRCAHEIGAVTVVDGVGFAPHGLPNVADLDADVYLISTYKTYGPHQGLMVVRRAVAERLANQGHFFNAGLVRKTLTPAGPDHAQIAACVGIADYLDQVHAHHFNTDTDADPVERTRGVYELFRGHERSLIRPLIDFLTDRPGIRVLGPLSEERFPILSIVLDTPARDAAIALAQHKIMAGGSHFYAYRLFQAMGLDPELGALRLSFTHYTTIAEIERLIAGLDAVLP